MNWFKNNKNESKNYLFWNDNYGSNILLGLAYAPNVYFFLTKKCEINIFLRGNLAAKTSEEKSSAKKKLKLK